MAGRHLTGQQSAVGGGGEVRQAKLSNFQLKEKLFPAVFFPVRVCVCVCERGIFYYVSFHLIKQMYSMLIQQLN